jgi:hypothetical protein
MFGGESMAKRYPGRTQDEVYCDDFEWYLRNKEDGDEGLGLILGALKRLDSIKYYKHLLKYCEEARIWMECLPHVSDHYCFLLILEFRWQAHTTKERTKAYAVINRINIRRYLNSSLKALDAVREKELCEEQAIDVLKEFVKNRLDTMDNALDFILD